jgi:tetratricopeptide (TPR) repeat protein
METTRSLSLLLVAASMHLSTPCVALAQAFAEHEHGELGTVEVVTSCSAAANAHLQRGLALLHHMMYDRAATSFAAAADVQPACAMAYWGQAMSLVHPIWSDPPAASVFAKGAMLADTAMKEGAKTARERAYVEAIQAYFKAGKTNKEAANLRAFASGWASVHQAYPDDPDAALFHALAQLATADPADKTYAQQRRAGDLIEKVFARHPNHPGAHHYFIHAYDYPPLAARALQVARAYGRIAPEVPHALHMPSHIFTRLGLWEDSIAWNQRSAAAALGKAVGGAVSLHYLHALDYLVYAHLQRGEDDKAAEVLANLQRLQGPLLPELASAYALAAVPARMALERQDWAAAMALEPRSPERFEWSSFPAVEAITHFARALGAAHRRDSSLARRSLDTLAALRDRAAESNAYWGTQVEIQRLAALAWLTFEQEDRRKGLEVMRQAAQLEATTEKHPVTPGEVLPASELLADMLLDMGEHAAARKHYEATLERSPHRLNSAYGLGRAAELAGDEAAAVKAYQQLIAFAVANGKARPDRVLHATRYLSSHR